MVSSSDDDDDRQGADDDEASRMSLGFKDYLNDEVKAVNSGSKYTFSQILKSDSANASGKCQFGVCALANLSLDRINQWR